MAIQLRRKEAQQTHEQTWTSNSLICLPQRKGWHLLRGVLACSPLLVPCLTLAAALIPMQYLESASALLRFYVRHIPTLYNLPHALKNPDALARILEGGGPFELKVPAAAAIEYNRGMQVLAARLRASSPPDPSPASFTVNLFVFFTLRIACCACAIAGASWQLCLAVASLQFLLLPHSLFVSVAQFVALFPPLFSGHIFVHVPLQLIAHHFFPALPFITISPAFIVLFFMLDFIQATSSLPSPLPPPARCPTLLPPPQCTVCAFVVPASAPSQSASKSLLSSYVRCYPLTFPVLFLTPCSFSSKNLLPCPSFASCHPSFSVFSTQRRARFSFQIPLLSFSFAHTQVFCSYFLLLLTCAPACRLNVAVWVIDAYLQLSPKFAAKFSEKTLHWAALFYHQHRLAHLPAVYPHAHKFHHHLPDACAFDAHIYGSGAPEEYFLLLAETVVAACLGCCPPSLSW